MAPITIIPKACSCCKGERPSRDKSSNLPLPNILYEGSKGGGSGSAADYKKGCGSAAGCVEGLWKKVLKMDGPTAQGFLSLTALQAEGCGGALRARILKKGRALRHFDRSEAEWRNLTPPWYRKHWVGRSLDSEYHQSVFHLPHTDMHLRSR